MESLSILLVGGVVLGVVFGYVLQRTRFCMAGAVSNAVLFSDFSMLKTYIVAVATAAFGTQLLEIGGWISLGNSPYLHTQVAWLAAMVGGLIFGFGTMLAGGCAGRLVMRTAEGDLGSLLVVAVIGLTGASALFGWLQPIYLAILDSATLSLASESSSLSDVLGVARWLPLVAAPVLGAVLLLFTPRGTQRKVIAWTGLALGGLVVAGWFVSGYLSQDFASSHQTTSVTYAGPIVSSFMVLTSGSVLSDTACFGLAILAGTVIGSAISAFASGRIRWTLPSRSRIPSLIAGGVLMGLGAMLAGGCNIGQGLTGMSTLSIKSLLAVSGFFVGMRLGLYWLSLETGGKSASNCQEHKPGGRIPLGLHR